MKNLDRIPVANPSVVSRMIANEAVLVMPILGQVKVLNGVGARIWSLIDGKRTVNDILKIIQAEYSVGKQEALKDLFDFLDQLEDRQIITFSD